MAFVLLGLSTLPCSDCTFETKNSTATTASVKHSAADEAGDHADACSPFCYCSCCSAISLNEQPSTPPDIAVFADRIFTSFLPAQITEVSLPVWQPPQIIA